MTAAAAVFEHRRGAFFRLRRGLRRLWQGSAACGWRHRAARRLSLPFGNLLFELGENLEEPALESGHRFLVGSPGRTRWSDDSIAPPRAWAGWGGRMDEIEELGGMEAGDPQDVEMVS